jgi:hypothetical protein
MDSARSNGWHFLRFQEIDGHLKFVDSADFPDQYDIQEVIDWV